MMGHSISIHLGCPVQRGVAGVGVRQGEQAGRGRHQPGQGRVLAQGVDIVDISRYLLSRGWLWLRC